MYRGAIASRATGQSRVTRRLLLFIVLALCPYLRLCFCVYSHCVQYSQTRLSAAIITDSSITTTVSPPRSLVRSFGLWMDDFYVTFDSALEIFFLISRCCRARKGYPRGHSIPQRVPSRRRKAHGSVGCGCRERGPPNWGGRR